MNLPDVLIWVLIVAGVAWGIFGIVVMVAVLNVAKEAIPHFRHMNQQRMREDIAARSKSLKHRL